MTSQKITLAHHPNRLALTLLGFGLALFTAVGQPRQVAGHEPSAREQPGPFRGKLEALDNAAGTIKLGSQKLYITPETKITKSGKPAKLEDASVGDEVTGFARKSNDGSLEVTAMHLGPRPETKPDDSHKGDAK